MLVLSRKPGETIRIGNAVITIVRMDGNKVRIGIEAPREVLVLRGELLEHGATEAEIAKDMEVEVAWLTRDGGA